MNHCELIFLGGVHGTGKGRFCERLCQVTRWEYLSASELLKWTEYVADPKSKEVKSIPETQARLLSGLEHACKPGRHYVLDGHFTLLDSNGHVKRIDRDTFEAIQPLAILVKTEHASVVRERLKSRDGMDYPMELIEQMLSEEAADALDLSQYLRVPHFLITAENEDEIITTIAGLQ